MSSNHTGCQYVNHTLMVGRHHTVTTWHCASSVGDERYPAFTKSPRCPTRYCLVVSGPMTCKSAIIIRSKHVTLYCDFLWSIKDWAWAVHRRILCQNLCDSTILEQTAEESNRFQSILNKTMRRSYLPLGFKSLDRYWNNDTPHCHDNSRYATIIQDKIQ